MVSSEIGSPVGETDLLYESVRQESEGRVRGRVWQLRGGRCLRESFSGLEANKTKYPGSDCQEKPRRVRRCNKGEEVLLGEPSLALGPRLAWDRKLHSKASLLEVRVGGPLWTHHPVRSWLEDAWGGWGYVASSVGGFPEEAAVGVSSEGGRSWRWRQEPGGCHRRHGFVSYAWQRSRKARGQERCGEGRRHGQVGSERSLWLWFGERNARVQND